MHRRSAPRSSVELASNLAPTFATSLATHRPLRRCTRKELPETIARRAPFVAHREASSHETISIARKNSRDAHDRRARAWPVELRGIGLH
jgi:hypothetical protein